MRGDGQVLRTTRACPPARPRRIAARSAGGATSPATALGEAWWFLDFLTVQLSM